MNIYKFNILLNGDEDFFREIEIASEQTFEDFHYAIIRSLKFNENELASFYLSNENWDKLDEITLVDMGLTESEGKLTLMKDIKIKDIVTKSFQKLIYVYDFLNLWTFNIELSRIQKPEKDAMYPRCVNKNGKPKRAQRDLVLDDIDFMLELE